MKMTIISVGNGGFNIASDIINAGLFKDIHFIVCDTDPNDLDRNSKKASDKFLLNRITQSEINSDMSHLVDKIIEHSSMNIILCSTLGGQMGSTYAPLIAMNAVTKGKYVFSLVSIPFNYEGNQKRDRAQKALKEMVATSNLIVIQDNDKLVNHNLGLDEMNKPIVDTLASIMAIAPSLSDSQITRIVIKT